MSHGSRASRVLAPAALLLGLAPLARAQAPADALAKLVPDGTVVYVQAPSLEKLNGAIRKVVAAFDAKAAEKFDLDEMIGSGGFPVSAKDIDHQKPLAFCLVLPEGAAGEPAPTFLLPAVAPEKMVQALAGEGMPFHATSEAGGYVTVSMVPAVKRGATPPAIALGLQAGEISARIDLKRLVEHFRPFIDMGLGQLQMAMAGGASASAPNGMDMAPAIKLYAECIKSVVDSGQSVDLAVRLDGNRLEIASALTVMEKSALADFGSKEKTDAKALARFIDPGAAMGIVLGMDAPAMMKRMKPWIDVALQIYPEPMRTDFQKMMGSMDEFAALVGSGISTSGGFDAGGMRYAIYLHPRDSAKLLAAYKTMLKSFTSVTVSESTESSVAGQPVTRMKIQIDAKALADGLAKNAKGKGVGEDQQARMKAILDKMYGKDGLTFTYATKGDVTAVLIGGDEAYQTAALARLSSPGSVPAGLARGLEQAGDLNPCFLMQYDIGKTMHDVQGLMGGIVPGADMNFPNASATITSWMAVDGRVWKGSTSMDLAEIGAFATAMKDMEAKSSPKSPKKD